MPGCSMPMWLPSMIGSAPQTARSRSTAIAAKARSTPKPAASSLAKPRHPRRNRTGSPSPGQGQWFATKTISTRSAIGGRPMRTIQRPRQAPWQSSDKYRTRGVYFHTERISKPRAITKSPIKHGFFGLPTASCARQLMPLRQIFPASRGPHCPQASRVLRGNRFARLESGFRKAHMSQQFLSRPLVIAPSILASDFAKLGEEV
ncbi:MAG: hypothetical protein QOF22_2230, partial [Bradyrhizobium sp.]|nr:hypothetical protein [Bradyrhizobium sp.]